MRVSITGNNAYDAIRKDETGENSIQVQLYKQNILFSP
jgi:hypothetical protein